MRAIQKQHIVDVFVWIDDAVASLPQTRNKESGGRPAILRDSELLTILIWDGLTEPHKTLHSLYAWIAREYGDYFPRLPAYQNFVAHCHRLHGQRHQASSLARVPLRVYLAAETETDLAHGHLAAHPVDHAAKD